MGLSVLCGGGVAGAGCHWDGPGLGSRYVLGGGTTDRSVTRIYALRSTGRGGRSVIERRRRPMPTIPDCTSSLIPNGSSPLISASSFSLFPVASTVITSRATSTTLARNRFTASSTRDLLSASALTFTRISSRCTVAPASSSTIFSTLISLFSCLVTCSRGCSSQLTTMVMREISSCSVGPTASESMLKLLRALTPAATTTTTPLFPTPTPPPPPPIPPLPPPPPPPPPTPP